MNEQLIFRANSKVLGACNHVRIFKGEKNVDYLEILIPQTYGGINLSECDCALTYIMPDGNENNLLINDCLQDYLYKELLVYQINIDERFTSVSGEIILYLTFTNNSNNDNDVVLKTSTAIIHINEHPSPSGNHNTTEEQKDLIAEILLRSKKALDVAKSIEERANNGDFDGKQGEQGIQGEKGENGEDGYSPTVSITDIENGHKVVIQDKEGEKSFDVFNGKIGKDGYTPVKNVDYFDGEKGDTGADGKSAFELYQQAYPEFTGTYIEWLESLKGEPGKQGEKGSDGKDYVLTEQDKEDISFLTVDDTLESSANKTYSINKIKNELEFMFVTQDELNEILDSTSPIMTEDELVDSLVDNYVNGGGAND